MPVIKPATVPTFKRPSPLMNATPDVAAAQQQQALAQAMFQRSLQPNMPVQNGPMAAKYGAGNALVDLATSLMAGWGMNQADKGVAAAKEADSANLAKALETYRSSVPDDQMGAASLENLRNAPADTLPDPVTSRSDAVMGLAKAGGPDAMRSLAGAMMQQGMTPPPVDEYTLKEGETRYRNGKPVAALAPKADVKYQDMGDKIAVIRDGQLVGYLPKGVTPDGKLAADTSRGNALLVDGRERGNQGLSPGYRWRADGTQEYIPGGPADPSRVPPQKTSDTERTAAGYLARMQNAEPLIGAYQPTTKDFVGFTQIMKGGPFAASLGNAAMSKEGQSYYQAASDWVRAKLRKESGAVIGPQEMEQEIRTYFPLPGDSREVVAQKARARATATQAMVGMAGPAAGAAPAQAAPGALGNPEMDVVTRWLQK